MAAIGFFIFEAREFTSRSGILVTPAASSTSGGQRSE
jgi:hypothetical protein